MTYHRSQMSPEERLARIEAACENYRNRDIGPLSFEAELQSLGVSPAERLEYLRIERVPPRSETDNVLDRRFGRK